MVIKFCHTSKAVTCRETKGLLCIANIAANRGVSDLFGSEKPLSRFFGGYATDANLESQASKARQYFI
jgi:hypothetical protein